MRQGILVVVSVALLLVGSGSLTPADAESFWYAIANVRIGGVHFSVGYHTPSSHRHRRYRGRYYRTRHKLRYKGHRCGSSCYRRGGYDYHHESCGLLGAHLRRNPYQPSYGGYWNEPYDDRYSDDRSYPYERYGDDRYYYDDGRYYYDDRYRKSDRRSNRRRRW